MVKLKLNDEEFEITTFSKTTFFSANGISRSGNCIIKLPDMETIETLAQETITVFEIYNDDNLIYEIEDANIHIEYVNESLENGVIVTSLNLIF